MRIVFFGASELGHSCYKLILDHKLCDVVGMFTIPQEFKISYSKRPVRNYLYADFHNLANEYHIPIIEVTEKMSFYRDQVAALNPDFLLVIGWYYMIPRSLREVAPKGCAGIHASLLPKYRGGAPLVWAMINGEKETGVSFFYLVDEADAGDIIAQKRFPIEQSDTIRDLLAKTESASHEILLEMLPKIADGTAPRTPQNHAEATTVPQRKPEDGLIDWSWSAERIQNFIRAQTRPYPGAFTVIDGKKVTIWEATVEEP